MAKKILMSNIGYLRGINGCLTHHVMYAHRHIYCSIGAQKKAQQQLLALLEQEDPDICCFVEIDKGSVNSAHFNQLEALLSEKYSFFDIENKYGQNSRLRKLSFTKGKSNAFIAKQNYDYEKVYFTHGAKRLVYKINIAPHVTLFFAHFSLKKDVRAYQLLQVKELLKETSGESIFLGDFNILTGFQELTPLLQQNHLRLLNREEDHTFTFHRTTKALDLCICSESLANKLDLKIIPQSYSDHAALLVTIK